VVGTEAFYFILNHMAVVAMMMVDEKIWRADDVIPEPSKI
jgi:hypothetical protein